MLSLASDIDVEKKLLNVKLKHLMNKCQFFSVSCNTFSEAAVHRCSSK